MPIRFSRPPPPRNKRQPNGNPKLKPYAVPCMPPQRGLLLVLVGLFLICTATWRAMDVTSSERLLHPQPAPPHPKLHVVTYVTETKGAGFCRFLLSALATGYDPIVLGGTSAATGDQAKKLKIGAYRSYISEKVPDDDVVLIVDGFDVYFQLGPTHLLTRYLSLMQNQPSWPVIASAEKGCWPFAMQGDQGKNKCLAAPASPIPPSVYGGPDTGSPEPWFKTTTPPRWLNAGSIIGYSRKGTSGMKSLFAGISDAEVDSAYDDQAVLLQRFVDGTHGITLDYYSELFQTFEASTMDLLLRNVSVPVPGYDEYGADVRAYWQNRFTNKVPILLHFNGEGKSGDHMERFWKDLYFVNSDPPFSPSPTHGFINQDGIFVPFDKVCPPVPKGL
ncbi:hypothetical protein SeMB42_g02267 [Synchytrium endobioticum]|uniref:PLOD1-3-like GT domain-containing protein n=1 Tax=Synchytrium endobioticum TaxID=286115 RepID=A0A507DFC3_9FUNG|nr:hypothetical protein SeLEV6574_g02640 [Synchytrium endobioticum]TPX50392.1 hypothetical protein SeMB42_g02267 [Synchytrium endobioticum]